MAFREEHVPETELLGFLFEVFDYGGVGVPSAGASGNLGCYYRVATEIVRCGSLEKRNNGGISG